MIDVKHTPEPWRTDEDGEIVRLIANPTGNPGGIREIGALYGTWANAKANARRIVACVNACAGIETEVLDKLPLTVRSVIDVAALAQQRDELLAIVEHVSAVLPNDRWAEDSKRMLDAAIASVKGGA